MLASHFPERLSVGLITAVYKSGDKSDMSNYRGITVGSVIAKAFAMILEQRIASWAENHAVKAKGQAGFRKDFRTTDNIFVLRSLIDKQRQTRQKGQCGKLYCCFVDFKKAFDTVNRDLLWQVLEGLGIQGRILEIIKSLYAHDSAAVRSSQGISAIFRCFLGVKQGCPLSPTLFGLYVDGLEKHLLQTAGIDAPELLGTLIPLLLYADDLILTSTTAAGLQKQLDALATFCKDRQLTVNLSKTKVVIFEARRSASVEFKLNGNAVDREDHYRYLGFNFHATKNMTYGVSHLVSAAGKAVHAMRRRCALLQLRDPRQLCKLFDILVLPILSYGSEVWATDPKTGAAAEVLHRQFLRRLLGVRDKTANDIVLAELGRYPLQIHFWQQIMRYHNRFLKLSTVTHLSKTALIAGSQFDSDVAAWRPQFRAFLETQPGQLRVFSELDISAIVDREKARHRAAVCASELSSVTVHRTLHPEYEYAQYLSQVRCLSNRRLISRFRSGCHGLHVDTGRFTKGGQKVEREQRVCQVCLSTAVEDEQHFLFDCPAYAHLRISHAELFHNNHCTVASFVNSSNMNLLGRHLRLCFVHRKSLLPAADQTVLA